MADYNGVWALVPETCSSRVDPNRASVGESEGFLINRWSQYVKSLMVDLVPGIVLGSIAAAGFLGFLIWFCVHWRRRAVIRRARRAKREAAKQAQFMASEPGDGDAAELGKPPPEQKETWWQALTAGRVLKWAIALVALATVGVAAWGLAESILATNGLIDSFWLLVDGVNQLAYDLTVSLANLGTSLSDVAGTLTTLKGALQKVLDFANSASNIPLIGGFVGNIVSKVPIDKLESVIGKADGAVAGLNTAAGVVNDQVVPVLNDTVLPAFDDIYRHQDWVENLGQTWRYVIVAVLFGLLILMAAAVGWACFTMRWGLTAIGLVAALWLLTAIVMFLGLGMLNGAKTVANDACLYSEDLITRTLNETLEGKGAVLAQNALDYYFGRTNLTDSRGNALLINGTAEECDAELTAALLRQVAGIDIGPTLVDVWNLAGGLPDIAAALGKVSLPTIPVVGFDLDEITRAVGDATDSLQTLLDNVCNTTLLLVRENRAWPLYLEIKTYVCCDLTNSVYDVWVPWVTAGSLALVLALLSSIRVVQATVSPTGRATGFDAAEPS